MKLVKLELRESKRRNHVVHNDHNNVLFKRSSARTIVNQKKGSIELSFHMILVMIGGTMFLLLFFLIIKSMISSSASYDTRTLTNTINTVIYNSITNTNSFEITRIPPDTIINYHCDLYSREINGRSVAVVDSSFFSINSELPGEGVSDKAMLRIPIFTQKKVVGSKLFTWTYTASLPYDVSNMVLITNNRTKFFFIKKGADRLLKRVVQELPSINYEVLAGDSINDFSKIKPEGYDNIRIVIFADSPTGASSAINALENTLSKYSSSKSFIDSLSLLVIITDNDHNYKHKLLFFDPVLDNNKLSFSLRNKDSSLQYYYGDGFLYGAIFSNDFNLFFCDYEKIIYKNKIIRIMLKSRTESLKEFFSSNSVCSDLYGQAIAFFDEDEGVSTDGFLTFDPGEGFGILEDINQRLIAFSCPTVY